MVRADIRRAKATPLKRVVTADDVAETMMSLIQGNRFVTGEIIVIDGGNDTEQVGGTSLSAPMFMGFWARIQTMHDNQLVSPNHAIYKYTKKKSNAKLYTHDVTSGSNGYQAGPGWDLGTGYGSLDVAAFADFVDTHAGF